MRKQYYKMWINNSRTYGLSACRHCMCCTAIVLCLCTNPINQWYNNVVPNSTNLLTYHGTPCLSCLSCSSNVVNHVENDHEAEQVCNNEINSSLLPNSDNYQIDGCLNVTSYSSLSGNQCQWQFNQMQPQGIQVNCNENYGQSPSNGLVEQQHQHLFNYSQGVHHDFSIPAPLSNVSLPSTYAGTVPEATIGSVEDPREWTLNQLSFSPFHTGNLIEEAFGSHLNTSSISSEGTQLLISRDALKKPSNSAPMSRQDRIQRYFEKKKARKYKPKKIYSSRKRYAQIRPRIRGRFARISQTDV